MKSASIILVLLFIFVPLLPKQSPIIKTNSDYAQIKKNAPKLFLDCNSCDLDFIRTNITFVNYVTEVKEAQIYLLITKLRTGSGGQEYTMEFSGEKNFKGITEKLKYISKQDDTDDEVRIGIVKTLKMGLIRYIKDSELAKYINISFTKKLDPTLTSDKWNSWVFNLSLRGWFNGQESYKSGNLMYIASANRVTPGSRIRLSLFSSKYTSHYKIEDGDDIESVSKSQSIKTTYVKSLGEHWSVGGFLNANKSSYKNKALEFRLSPSIEYNIFPYKEATKKQFRIQYSIGFKKVKYIDETIYGKLSETLYFHDISFSLELKQKWGSINSSISGSNYFHDFNKYSADISTSISWRIIKGLSFEFSGGYSLIHDQLYLPKGELTNEEILLHVSALATSYAYWFSTGIRFTFGSVYNNVVNPRFGF